MLILADLPWTGMTKSSQFCKVCDSLIPGSAAGLEKLEKRRRSSRPGSADYELRLKTNSHANEAWKRDPTSRIKANDAIHANKKVISDMESRRSLFILP